jgi:CBS domain containing-hemolysin-like protein
MERVSLMMAGAQLGITMCSLGLGAIGEPAVAHLLEPVLDRFGVPEEVLHPLAFTVALGIVVALHMVLGEMVPKNIAIARPERSALFLGPPLYAVVTALKPLIALLNWLANIVLRALRVTPQDEVASTFTADQVAGFVAESRREGLLDETEHELLAGALELAVARVGAVAIPFDQLVTVPVGVTVAELDDTCGRTGFSRFPVVDPDGEVVGYIHLKDVLGTPPERLAEPAPPELVRPLVTVSSDATLRDALTAMQARGAHLARVVDPQASSPVGIAMLEDVIEELVGEVVDAGQQQTGG